MRVRKDETANLSFLTRILVLYVMKTKSFDCVAMKEAGAERVQEQLAGLTTAQILEFWRTRTDALRQEQLRVPGQTHLQG